MNLKTKPFYLDDEAVNWVETTLKQLSIAEKIGQLFLPIGYSTDTEYLDNLLSYHIGGLFFRSGKAQEVQKTYQYVQEKSKIPLLTAANLEDGGNGAAIEATCLW
ncbi:hypothetical protein [Enterococcus faecium]|uniref:hypothetical protein n=1 Tax=Enterococcus faecium TaxID=1352 RepID=UPI000B6C0BBE|nr:hypothetical protein [Enterococcus faecium]OTN91556.1 beta-N-acetylglucosaminidase/beta-glucosidase [Enterococcus faecium]